MSADRLLIGSRPDVPAAVTPSASSHDHLANSRYKVRIPDFFIVGAPKCGTTSVDAWLRAHPAISMSASKEPSFFDTDSPLVGVRKLSHYLRCFSDARDEHSAVGETSPNYLFSQVAVANVLEFNPAARFVVLARNPIEMAPSLHSQLLYNFHEDETNFAVAWGLQEKRARGLAIPVDCRLPQFLQYRSACALGAQLQRLLSKIVRSRVHVILLDDIRESPRTAYLSLLAFLGVPDDGRVDLPVLNSRVNRRAIPFHLLRRNTGYLKQRLGAAHLHWRFPRVSKGRIASAASAVARLTPTALTVPVDDAMLSVLEDTFRDDIGLLEQILGRDLGAKWLRK